jgi:hypothetical protein
MSPQGDHRPTPAGLLVDALTPRAYADLDIITEVVDRLGVDLTAHLADLIARSRDRAMLDAVKSTADLLGSVQVPDEAAHAARARLGHQSGVAAAIRDETREAEPELRPAPVRDSTGRFRAGGPEVTDAGHYIDGNSGSGWPR